MIITAIKIVLAASVAAANAFYLLCIWAGYKFFSGRQKVSNSEFPPATIMVPLSGADFGAYENYSALCRQDYPRYEIVFGVRDPEDSSIPVVEKLKSDFPGIDIELVICPDTIGQNLKVSNLQNMLARATHEHIVIVDSDILAGRDYLRRVLQPLAEDGVGLVTCLYRAAEAPDFAARLEAIGITAEFHPGVLAARMLEGVKFALGSTMATTKARLEEVGGFHALKDYLADDFMLGYLIARRGYEVRLSDYVVELRLEPAGFKKMVRHQTRWARSTRRSRPAGYFGLILTYGTVLALALAAVDGAAVSSLSVLAATLFIRLTMGWVIGVRWLKDGVLKKNLWLLPLRDLLSFAIWCLSWTGRRIEWRGRVFEIVEDGKIALVGQLDDKTGYRRALH
jgi:ceramide glucosyltransferase